MIASGDHDSALGFQASAATVRLVRYLVLLIVIAVSGCNSEKCTAPEPQNSRGLTDSYPAWSPDGKTIAFFRGEYDGFTIEQRSLMTVDVETGKMDSTPTTEFVSDLTWSPDGRWLLFASGNGICKLRPNGDSLTMLTSSGIAASPTWSPVSNRIYYCVYNGSEAGLHSVNPDGSGHYRWTDPDNLISFWTPSCSSDSDTLLGRTFRPSDYCLAAYYPGDTAVTSVLACGYEWLHMVKSSPDGRYVAFNSTSETDPAKIVLFLLDRADGSIRSFEAVRAVSFDFSPDGRFIVYSDFFKTGALKVVDLDTGEQIQLTSPRDES